MNLFQLILPGAVIYPIMFHKLIGSVGFGWTTRIIAFVALAGLCFSFAVMKLRLPPPNQSRSMFDLSAFNEPPFLIFSFALFFAFIGLYFPFFYLPGFFTSYLHSNGDISFYSIAVLNAASVFGRITPGLVADQIGSLNTIIPMSSIAAVMGLAWIGIRNEAGAIVFAVIYGYASGALVSLSPTVLAGLTPNMSTLGTRMGMCFVFSGMGLLIGNPIAGALLDLERGVFWKAQLFSAMTVIAGSALFLVLRVMKWKRGEGWRI